MRVLLLGGTGTLSHACAARAIDAGHNLTLVVRGTRDRFAPSGARIVHADLAQADELPPAIAGHRWDVVVDFNVFTADRAERDIRWFRGHADRFVFISSTSVYTKPLPPGRLSESAPVGNPLWDYADRKAQAEHSFHSAHRDESFPVLTVRPGHVYADFLPPRAIPGLGHGLTQRLLLGRPIPVHDDGRAEWPLLHAEDFGRVLVSLLERPGLEGETVQVAGEQPHTWADIYSCYARILGVRAQLASLPSKALAALDPDFGGSLLGDKAHSHRFDLTRLRRYVPGQVERVSLEDGLRRCADWYRRNPSLAPASSRAESLVKAALDRFEALRRQQDQ